LGGILRATGERQHERNADGGQDTTN
jgi:hypothetical protein